MSAAQAEGARIRTDLLHRGLVGAGEHLGEILEAEHFDLVHTHTDRASALAAIASGFRSRWPVVRTVHGAPEYSGMWAGLTQAVARVAERVTQAHQVLVSHDLQRTLKREGTPRTHVIHNGLVPPARTGAHPAGYAQDRVNLVVVGRLGRVKGFEYLIRALALLANGPLLLHIVGDGPDRLSLEQLVHDLKLTGQVSFHGFRADVHDYIRAADALIMPSLHEGIPYVLLEALWLGTPVIASEVGGIPEVLIHDQNGYLVPAKTPAALARAIEALLQDPTRFERLARVGKQTVQRHFSAQSMAEQYGRLYRALLNR